MTLKEVKDESKQTEGSPEVRAKIRRMQYQQAQESSRQREALGNVGDATTVVTNPTHFAVALKYAAGQEGAPVVLAMGRGQMAMQIIERAKEARVRTLRIPMLARALYFTRKSAVKSPKVCIMPSRSLQASTDSGRHGCLNLRCCRNCGLTSMAIWSGRVMARNRKRVALVR